ncbi:DUF4349 domain-containing protein [Brachyspira aalborgi]|uniref:DUF4349 domain-containing protein n=1 Tax=Brachyspira aalborgi TaxID=29522 RepID=UPI00266B8D68|nr:DUF4349 domain-containing protein [Brachyspira aalborgi]
MKNIIYSFIIIILISCARANTDSFEAIQTTADNSFEEESVSERKTESFNNYNSKNEIEENNIKERKLIISVDLSVNSKDIEKSYKSIEEKVKEYKGYFENIDSYKYRYFIALRIPKDNLYNFLEFIENNQNVQNKNINTEDVTENYYDIENRIKNREALLDKFRNYLKEAKNIEEILSVEDRINNLTYEIERMKGNFENLTSLIEYSKVNITIKNSEAMRRNINFYDKFLYTINFLKYFFSSIIFFLIGFVTIAIPIVLLLALFYYIAFGKIGLIKKLYKKIK